MSTTLFDLPETNTIRVAVKDLPLDDQPRTRLQWYGAGSLSIVELLQIIAGTPYLTPMQALLAQAGTLFDLARMPTCDMTAVDGVGPVAADRLKAAFELGRRACHATPTDQVQVKSPADVAGLLTAQLMGLEQEHFVVLSLDTKNRVVDKTTLYIGSLNSASIRVGEVFRQPIRRQAAGVVVAHNHPSGDPTPSPEDVAVTRQIVEAGKLMDIPVLDHLVIGGAGRWVSLKERGLGF